MSQQSENSKRIAKNTLILYLRMLVMMAISLFTSRITLSTLGIEDFGIYNVVGGVVAMFGIISGTLSAAISRFLTFELGIGNMDKLKTVFSTSVNIQIILSIIIIIVGETVGLWFLNAKLVIPPERLFAANMVYQFSIATCVIGLMNMPYYASIIAHERMSAFAYMSIYDVGCKLAVVLAIIYIPYDRLITFSFLLALFSLTSIFIYHHYSKKNFEECRYHFVLDTELLKKMFGFAGWNFVGASSAILRDQGGNIIINLFCGPAVNAARGVAMQVNTAVSNFVNNFMIAVDPQITKSYAAKDYDYMMKLVFQSARLSFYILFILSLPIIITTPYLLDLWLDKVPEHADNFVRLILIYTMSESLAHPLITVMLATGKIRNYQLVVGGLQLLNLPLSYMGLRMGLPPEFVMVVAVIVSIVCELARLIMLRNMIGLSVRSFMRRVYLNVIGVTLLAAIVPVGISTLLQDNFITFIVLCAISVACASIVIYFVGCNINERLMVNRQIVKFKNKVLGK